MQDSNIKVALVDDHKMMRSALAGFISHEEGIDIHFEASDSIELMTKMQWDVKPDVILMDYGLGKEVGSECIAEIRKIYGEEIRILGLSMHQSNAIVQEMIDAGANGYLFKGTDTNEMIKAIKDVVENGFFINEFTRNMVFGHNGSSDKATKLNSSEKKIIKLICQEKNNDEMSELLNLSSHTVHTYRKRLLKKLECKNTAGLVVYAIKNNLYSV